jgi:PAS domain-containing protein
LQGVLSAAVLAAPTGIVVCDPNLPDCPVIYANPAFYRITGYSEEEVIGRNCRFLQGPGTNPRHIKALREAIESGKAINVEIVNHRDLMPLPQQMRTHMRPDKTSSAGHQNFHQSNLVIAFHSQQELLSLDRESNLV